jgi:ssRNA-specific RNase YbeY (16S rRNA maturation enzyme)
MYHIAQKAMVTMVNTSTNPQQTYSEAQLEKAVVHALHLCFYDHIENWLLGNRKVVL